MLFSYIAGRKTGTPSVITGMTWRNEMQIDFLTLLSEAGVPAQDETDRGEVRYIRYEIPNTMTINVQCTASQVLDDITCLKPDFQEKLFVRLAEKIQGPGETLTILDEKKKRGVFVTRLVGEDSSEVNFSITR